jgi:guanine deaminase
METKDKFTRTAPILTPRFIPACSDELMVKLRELQIEFGLPVQSHLSENKSEIEWVRELCPEAESYADAYNCFGLFGSGGGIPTIMAHCVWCEGSEEELLRRNGVYVAHCPQSNMNLSSGIAPIRRFLRKGIRVGLGSDVAGGCHTAILRAMSDAIQASKLYWRLVDQNDVPLTVQEAFYLGTIGGGSFFGKVGSFEEGYEFDAVIIDDSGMPSSNPLSLEERLARIIYLSDESCIRGKYVRGKRVDIG